MTDREVVRYSTAEVRLWTAWMLPGLVVCAFMGSFAFQEPLGFVTLAAGLYGVANIRRIRSEGFMVSDTQFVFPSLRFLRRLKIPKDSVTLCVVAHRPSRIWLELLDGQHVWFKFASLRLAAGHLDPRVVEVGHTMRRELVGTKAVVLVDPRREDIPSMSADGRDAQVAKEWIWPDRTEAVWLIVFASLWFLFFAAGASAAGVAQ